MSTTEIENLEFEIRILQEKLCQKKLELQNLKNGFRTDPAIPRGSRYCQSLQPLEVSRYSRQMIMPSIGINGQCKLKKSNVLIVGMGGLGCPAAQYLTAAGIGTLDILDFDEVEITNLHRQILHGENNINELKVKSGYEALKRINSNVKVNPIHMHANGDSLQKLLSEKKYDVVLDCTDNVATRYMLNDICVLNNVPLVSGSALQLEGQLTVYNYKKGPCYRCLFSTPPPPETVTSCGDGGVLGPIPGVIGVLQALEAIKVILHFPDVLSGRLLIFDGSNTTFRNIILRKRNPQCDVCGDKPVITKPIDYEQFCGSKADDKITDINIVDESDEKDVEDLVSAIESNQVILDVRSPMEFEMCRLENSLNFPYKDILKKNNIQALHALIKDSTNLAKVYVICRRGNDSQRAINILKEMFREYPIRFFNIKGGLHSYSKNIDPSFPLY